MKKRDKMQYYSSISSSSLSCIGVVSLIAYGVSKSIKKI